MVTVSPGAHVLAPSDMMDNRVLAIKNALKQEQMLNKVYIINTCEPNVHTA